MRMPRRMLVFVVVWVVFSTVVFIGLTWAGIAEAHFGCRADQRSYDSVHRVIDAAFTPPTSVLTPQERHLVDQYRARMFTAQGKRPKCGLLGA